MTNALREIFGILWKAKKYEDAVAILQGAENALGDLAAPDADFKAIVSQELSLAKANLQKRRARSASQTSGSLGNNKTPSPCHAGTSPIPGGVTSRTTPTIRHHSRGNGLDTPVTSLELSAVAQHLAGTAQSQPPQRSRSAAGPHRSPLEVTAASLQAPIGTATFSSRNSSQRRGHRSIDTSSLTPCGLATTSTAILHQADHHHHHPSLPEIRVDTSHRSSSGLQRISVSGDWPEVPVNDQEQTFVAPPMEKSTSEPSRLSSLRPPTNAHTSHQYTNGTSLLEILDG